MFMMQSINRITIRGVLGFWVACAVSTSGYASVSTPEGTWKFERSMDYYGRTPLNQAPKFDMLVVRAKEVRLSDTCVAQFSPGDYAFPDVFQPLSKEGGTEKQLDSFLSKHFGVALSKVSTVYSLARSPGNCARPVMEFFQVGDRLLIPVGATFYSYVRARGTKPSATPGAAPESKATGILSPYKLTALPIDFNRYVNQCRPKILGPKGRPQTTDKCAPEFYPYVADAKSSDPLMKLVGLHDYAKGGSEYADGFSPPFIQKTTAIFLVFPPIKQVALVRVDDFEVVRNEERDIMTGVYLSIVAGKVVDQISGCHFDRDYICMEEGRPVAKLTANGKFLLL
jgi:hypothetical protein